MARLITELTAAGPVDGGNDLLWIEQSALPRKITINSLAKASGGAVSDASGSIASSGWYRVAQSTGTAGRGQAIISINSQGGGEGPGGCSFMVHKSWLATGEDIQITVLSNGYGAASNVVEQIRVTHDTTTTNNIFVEVFLNPGSATTYQVDIRPFYSDTTTFNWNAIAFTAGQLEDFTKTVDLATDGVLMGVFAGRGSQSAAYFGDQGQLFLKADIDNSTEGDTPFIRMEQDGGVVPTILGSVGFADVDGQGNTMLDMPNNGFAIHQNWASGSIGLGVNGQLGFLLNDNDQIQVLTNSGDLRFLYRREVIGTDNFMRLGDQSGNVFVGMAIGDTRDTDHQPLDYDNILAAEFKDSDTVNDPSIFDGDYGGLITVAPWSDGSGGHKHQLFFHEQSIFHRSQPGGNAAWNTDGRGRWKPLRTGMQYDNGSVEVQEYFPDATCSLSIDTATQTGAIKIELPVNLGDNVMLYMEVEGYDYDTAWNDAGEQGGGAWAVALSGYTFSTGWANNHAHIIHGNPKFRRVRFYDDGVNAGFFLGETTDVHEYPKIMIKKIVVTFADPSAHNWTQDIVTTLETSTAGLTFDATGAYLHKTHSPNGSFAPAGRIYPQQVSNVTPQLVGYIDEPTLRGSINVAGAAAGGYSGYAINNILHFMTNGTTSGIYDEGPDYWRVTFDEANNITGLWAEGVETFVTQQYNGSGNTTGAQVRGHDNVLYDVGLNQLPLFNINASDTLEAQHCGAITGTDNTTAYTLTLAASGDTDFPVGGVATIVNGGTSGNYTVNEGSGTTLYFVEPGSGLVDTAGGCTIGPGGTATLWRRSTTEYWIWGSEITP